jgi:hypothetical protein
MCTPRIAPQVLPQIGRHGNTVVAHLFHRQGHVVRGPLFRIRHARAALVPLHQGVILLPPGIDGVGKRTQGIAGTAMDKQEHGIAAGGARDRDPLLDTVDGHVALFAHGLRGRGANGASGKSGFGCLDKPKAGQ